MGLGAENELRVLATATPAEVTSELLARALYSNYVGHAHIDYALSMALFEFVHVYGFTLCAHLSCAHIHMLCYYTGWCHVFET